MQAVISGQARTAFLVDENWLGSIDADDPETISCRSAMDFHRLFQFAEDVIFLEDVTRDDVRKLLNATSRGADVFALVLLILDPEQPLEIRKDASADLGQIMDAEAGHWAERLLLAQYAPSEADFAGAVSLSDDEECVAFLRRLEALQPFILATAAAWSSIPDDMFESLANRTQFDAVMVREGVFRDFVHAACAETNADAVVSTALSLPAARALPNRSRVLSEWRNRLFEALPGTAEPDNLPRVLLRAVQSIPERLALSLAQTLSITARHALAASSHAPVPTVGDVEWRRLQVPLKQYFRTSLVLPDNLLAPWSGATLSVQRRPDRLRFVLNAPPSRQALVISVANCKPVELDQHSVVAEVPLPGNVSVANLRMAIIPFHREPPAN
ncbi:MAG: hypothetical protein AB2730_20210 [Candidatus Thiodiazotropha sp.]